MKFFKKGKIVQYLICAFLLLFFFGLNLVFSQETKRMQIGSLHGWFADKGCEIEEGRYKQQQDGLAWPAFYYDQDCQAAKGLWIGTTNFKDPVSNVTYDYKVVCCGPRLWGNGEFFATKFDMTTKFQPPSIFVDNTPSTYIQNYINSEDPKQKPDRIITNVVNTAIGITMTRKIIAFSQQDNDNYFIYDYVFKNTGNINDDDRIELPNNTLTGIYFYYQYRYAASFEGAAFVADPPRWGINGVIGTRGDGTKPGGKDEDLRCQFEFMGKYSKVNFDCIGGPHFQKGVSTHTEQINGHLGAAQHVGIATLHADKSPTDTTDDTNQPSTTSYESSDDNLNRSDISDQFNKDKMASRYAWMAKGHVKPRYQDLIGTGFADQFGGSGGNSVANGFGPYTLKPGESVHIVMAEGVAGLSRKQCYDIGSDWLAKKCTFPGITDNDQAKNAWVFTGADSLMKTFRRALANYKSGYNIPQAPLPPDKFEVISGGDRITLKWSKSAESDPTFGGYRIFRADSTWDNRKYTLIFECGKGTSNPTVVNTFDDKTPVRGFQYFYYIQSVGDGSNNNGAVLASNRQYTQTYDPAYLRRKAGEALKDIRVVPNPYNVKAQSYQYVGETDKIMFLNLPGVCKIKIYTERGDLIYQMEHNDGSGDASWYSVTSSNQIVVSGVYIAYFETPDGQSTYRKFVIIR